MSSQSAPGITVFVPDIGDFKDVPVIEVLVTPGAVVAAGDPVVVLESEKATLDVPAPTSGRVVAVAVSAGARVSCGTALLTLTEERPTGSAQDRLQGSPPSEAQSLQMDTLEERRDSADRQPGQPLNDSASVSTPTDSERKTESVYASPSVRRLGREMGVDLRQLSGSGRGGRILKEDVQRRIQQRPDGQWDGSKQAEPKPETTSKAEFTQFGEVERQPLSRIRRISGATLSRNWASIPHVTNFDEADVSELDRFRVLLNEERTASAKITMLSFLVMACASALEHLPAFNASLDGNDIVLKKYVNIGVAVDTPVGLVVPVIRNVDRLGLREIVAEIANKAALAREGRLKFSDMEGGCFSISSLGGIGGSTFTPIINAPEIAILGAGRAKILPRWDGSQFMPRLILPLSLSWDHRALDGALAARFLAHLVTLLEDFRRISL